MRRFELPTYHSEGGHVVLATLHALFQLIFLDLSIFVCFFIYSRILFYPNQSGGSDLNRRNLGLRPSTITILSPPDATGRIRTFDFHLSDGITNIRVAHQTKLCYCRISFTACFYMFFIAVCAVTLSVFNISFVVKES